MREFRREVFEHKGKQFSLRVSVEGDYYKVIAYLDEKQVSPVYGMDIKTHHDFFAIHQGDLIDGLLHLARSDIEREIYFHE
jgi:hypothetical protein